MSKISIANVVAPALLATALPALAQQAQPDFPDGPGKQALTQYCGSCHDVNRVRAGYTPEGWRTVIRMMQNMQVPVPQDQWAVLTDYLIKNFPERPRPRQPPGREPTRRAPA